ncbi:hypothetical protein HPP92_018029 [Vanilla planifolia]|uniref:YdbS-like PH domain-containing protein n=1 Tax=Vanilla planifolia TaxID=51239 RepID=A0A835Q606_VANPL|nr:hypothetical protein HPP92_018595 [Vanilla planifolia]KAG0468701.1 hypothetical protein HPP92_018029 [Vanilla planifolia]
MVAAILLSPSPPSHSRSIFPSKPFSKTLLLSRIPFKLFLSPTTSTSSKFPSSAAVGNQKEERIFFDGGSHYGDLVTNLLLGFTLIWLPLTIAAVSRAFFLRYRITNRRVTVISGFTGQDRSDFPYSAIKDVQAVPRLIGEWGDIVVTLKDGTKVDIRGMPRFRMVADYCLLMAEVATKSSLESKSGFGPRGF